MTGGGTILLCDLGLAKVLTAEGICSGLTTTSTPLTVRWSSPEILESIKSRALGSDVWAWGCCALEVREWNSVAFRTNTLRFQIIDNNIPYYRHTEQSHWSIASKILGGELPSQSANFERVPGLKTIVETCWRRGASDRPTASECATLVSELVGSLLISITLH